MTAKLPLLFLAACLVPGSVFCASNGPADETRSAIRAEALSPAIQAGPIETQYGMAEPERSRFNAGVRSVRDDSSVVVRPEFSPEEDAGQEASAAEQEAPAALPAEAFTGETNPILEATGHGRQKPRKRSLVDAPGPIPLPARMLPPPPSPSLMMQVGRTIRVAPAHMGQAVLAPETPIIIRKYAPKPGTSSPTVSPFNRPSGAGNSAPGVPAWGSRPAAAPFSQPFSQIPQASPVPVFVEIRLEPPSPNLLTPVKALEAGMGFFFDRSFPVLMSSPERRTAFVRGWTTSDKIMFLTMDPRVIRVTAAGESGAQAYGTLRDIPVTLTLRMGAGERLSSFIGRTVAGLERQAGFRWRVSRGYQRATTSSGNMVALTGDLPASSTDRLLSYPDLLRVEPYLTPPAEQGASASGSRTPPAPIKTAHRVMNLAILTLAFPWMGIMIREIFFWIQSFLY